MGVAKIDPTIDLTRSPPRLTELSGTSAASKAIQKQDASTSASGPADTEPPEPSKLFASEPRALRTERDVLARSTGYNEEGFP